MKTETIIIAEGFIAGIIIALPKGPAGFAVINQTIVYGFVRGFIIAFGCIVTTILVTPVVLFPTMDVVKDFFERLEHIARQFPWILGVVSVVIGIVVFRLKQEKDILSKQDAYKRAIKLFVFTLLEPSTVVQTSLIFSNLPKLFDKFHLCSVDILHCDKPEKLLFFLSVISGTTLWYVVTGLIINRWSENKILPAIEKINKFFGLLFIIAGFIALLL